MRTYCSSKGVHTCTNSASTASSSSSAVKPDMRSCACTTICSCIWSGCAVQIVMTRLQPMHSSAGCQPQHYAVHGCSKLILTVQVITSGFVKTFSGSSRGCAVVRRPAAARNLTMCAKLRDLVRRSTSFLDTELEVGVVLHVVVGSVFATINTRHSQHEATANKKDLRGTISTRQPSTRRFARHIAGDSRRS